MTSEPVSLAEVFKSASRLPFAQREAETLELFLRGSQKSGLDLSIHHGALEDIPEMLREGIVLLESCTLKTQLAFINVNAGRGFFGVQKNRVLTYTGDLYSTDYFAGPVLPSLLRALVGVNNLYRNEGLFRGSGI